jgi:hypothetical protein
MPSAKKLADQPPAHSYEERLTNDVRFAMAEMGSFFEGNSKVHRALRKITRKLDELQIPYAVVGGLALFRHGYRRTTDDVDLLVTSSDLRKIHEHLDGLGYIPPFKNSKHLRDVEEGVRIEFLTTGDFPGDGKPKEVAFPDPAIASTEADGIRYLNLIPLIELKLASGLSATHRRKDLVDVQELIKALTLPKDFAEKLRKSVAGEYSRLWSEVNAPRRFITLWRNKWLASKATTLPEMIGALRSAAETLEAMLKDGVTLDVASGRVEDDYARLVTTDPEIARKYDMQPEEDFLTDSGEVDDK